MTSSGRFTVGFAVTWGVAVLAMMTACLYARVPDSSTIVRERYLTAIGTAALESYLRDVRPCITDDSSVSRPVSSIKPIELAISNVVTAAFGDGFDNVVVAWRYNAPQLSLVTCDVETQRAGPEFAFRGDSYRGTTFVAKVTPNLVVCPAGAAANQLALYDTQLRREIARSDPLGEVPISSIAVDSQSGMIVVANLRGEYFNLRHVTNPFEGGLEDRVVYGYHALTVSSSSQAPSVISNLRFSPDGRIIAGLTTAGSLMGFDVRNGWKLFDISRLPNTAYSFDDYRFALSHEGLLYVRSNGDIFELEAKSQRKSPVFRSNDGPKDILLSKHAAWLAYPILRS